MFIRTNHYFFTKPFPATIIKFRLRRKMTTCQNSEKHFFTAVTEKVGRFTANRWGRNSDFTQTRTNISGCWGAEMHRAVRLVVDTGMHSKGWTREQAIQYCLENEAESEAGITSEIERYMANPGQALAYKIGQLKILELRHKA